ncbi:hypothetical protein Goari_027121 [Gossypium aridum]|uniref:DUF4283 domain-containing protein n=1 Tax=Gossypium aridum TaxID=34290 RepID=A0A7J8YNC1_GOSAI|nr:hypothetical protein [Gossypium aridum]
MKSTLANLWHPICGVQIRDIGEKRYLFKFFHSMDMERVLKGLPWTFNNHLLILSKLRRGEDPLKIPLVYVSFWVQIHDVPIGLFSESLGRLWGNFIRVFLEYDGSDLGNRNYMRVRVQIDVRKPLKRKKQTKMMMGTDFTEMGWDLSLRAPSHRALSMNSIWLQEEEDGDREGSWMENRSKGG